MVCGHLSPPRHSVRPPRFLPSDFGHLDCSSLDLSAYLLLTEYLPKPQSFSLICLSSYLITSLCNALGHFLLDSQYIRLGSEMPSPKKMAKSDGHDTTPARTRRGSPLLCNSPISSKRHTTGDHDQALQSGLNILHCSSEHALYWFHWRPNTKRMLR
jgi:hypothetical protein